MGMESNPGLSGRVADLSLTLNSSKTTRDARIDIYQVLVREISKDTPDVIEDFLKSATLIQKKIEDDIKLDDSGLTQGALNILGYLLHIPDIVGSFSNNTLTTVMQDLCTLLKTSNDKGVCARALWCLSRQSIPDEIVSKELTKLLPVLNLCIVGKNFESSTVEFEAINVYQRLLMQCPERLLTNDDDWFKMVYPFVISNNVKVADRALHFLEKNLDQFEGRSEKFSKSLISDLNEGLTDRLKIMFCKDREVFVLRVWSCYITVLGKNMHQGSPLTNSLFKVVEQAFKSSMNEVLVAAFEAWKSLIDNFATSKAAILSKKRLKLLLMPLVNCRSKSERNLKVEQSRLKCWLHLIQAVKDDLNAIFDEVIPPLLQFIFSTPDVSAKNVDFALNKSPTKGSRRDVARGQTPRAPAAKEFDSAVQASPKYKHLYFDSTVLKKIGAQILYLVLNTDETADESLDMKFPFTLERLTLKNFANNSVVFMVALQDLTWNCGKTLDEKLFLAIWQCMLHYVTKTASSDEKESLTLVIGGILSILKIIASTDCTSQQLALRIISLCYWQLKDIMIENKDLVKTENNPQGSFPLHIIQILFDESRFVRNKIFNKFYTLYDSLLRAVVSGVSGQFYAFSQISSTIKKFSVSSADPDATRLLWNATAECLTCYIDQAHEVNQGDNLNPDFSVILDVLLLPLIKLFNTDLPTAVVKEIEVCWSNLLSSFVRESSLLPTVEENQALEELCKKINQLIVSGEIVLDDYQFLGKLLHILSTVAQNLSYTQRMMENQGNKTRLRSESPLKNANSLVTLFEKLFSRLTTADAVKDKLAEQSLWELLDVIGVYFGKITGSDLILESIDRLGKMISTFISEEKPKGESSVSSKRALVRKSTGSKHIYIVGGVFNEIYTCIFERFGKPLDNELLLAIVPVLKAAFLCERSIVRSRAIEFWNKSFGQMSNLVYPEDLKCILQQVKDNAALIVPGLEVDKDNSMVRSESEGSPPPTVPHSPNIRKTMTPSLRSPHKIHGSFLQKALSAEKAARSPSPRKVLAPKSPKSESKIRPARRKLPLLLDNEDSNEFVRIAPSPKKRRILTEHQKEVLRTKSDVPTLYNQLDQQTQEPIFTEDTQCTMDAVDHQTSNADSRSAPVENGPKDAGTANQASLNGSFRLEITEDLSKSADGKKKTTPLQNTFETSLGSAMGDVMGTQHEGDHNDSSQSPEKISAKGEKGKNMAKRKSKKKVNTVKKKSSEIRAEKDKSPKKGNKRSTRRSLKTSFKDILKSIEEKIAAENTDEALLGLKAVKVEETDALEGEVIQSSYTPLHSSEAEKPLPFEFSSASLFSKAARSFAAGSLADSESSASNVEGTDKDSNVTTQANLNGNVGATANDDAVVSNESSTSPDLIPSSQSQRDATPILKGVTMANPRRSFRRVKKTERLLEAENSNAIKISLAKLSRTVLCKMGNMRKKQGDQTIVDETEDMEKEQDSLDQLGVVQKEAQVNVQCNEHQGEAVEEEGVTVEVAVEEAVKREPSATEDVMTSMEELLNRFAVAPDKLANDADAMFDNEMDSALCEIDLETASEKGEPMQDNVESKSYEELGEHLPQRRRSKKNAKQKSPLRENDDKLVAEAENDEGMNGRDRSQQITGEGNEVNSSCEPTVSKKRGRRSRKKNKVDMEHNKAEKSDVENRRKTRGSKASKIDKFSNENSSDAKLLVRRSTRSTTLKEQTKELAVAASGNADQKESEATNKLDSKDHISPRKSCAGDPVHNDNENFGAEDCHIELVSDLNDNGEDFVDAAEASPSASAQSPSANEKRKRKSRKRVADRDKRSSNSSHKGTLQMVAGLSKLKEFMEIEENKRADHILSSKVDNVFEKMQDNTSTVSSDLGLDENYTQLQKSATDIPGTLDGICNAAQGSVKKVSAHDKVEESYEITDDSMQFNAVKTSEGEVNERSNLASSELECATKFPPVEKIPGNEHLKGDPVPVVNGNEKPKAKRRSPRKVGSQKCRKPKARLSRTDFSAKGECKNAEPYSGTMNSPSKAKVRDEDESESSSEDCLTLSEISTRAAKEQHGTSCCEQDAKRNSYAAKENQLGTLESRVEDNKMVGSSAEGRIETSEAEGDIDIIRKKEVGNFPSNIASETIENIFNSPDSSEKLDNQLLPQRGTFLILERTSIEESDIATLAKDDVEQTPNNNGSKTGDSLILNDEKEIDFKTVDDFQKDGPSSNLRNHHNFDSRVSETSRERSESQHVSMASRSSAFADSPLGKRKGIGEFSPRSGILKRRAADKPDTPSPPNKNRRVSFAFPLEEKRSISDMMDPEKYNELAVPLPTNEVNESSVVSVRGTPRRFTAIRKRSNSTKISSSSKGPPICPELVDCTMPIECLLPSITSGSSSLGLGNFIRSQNIRTIGNLCVLSASQIEALPIRAPKVSVVKAALKKYMSIQKKGDKSKAFQSPLANDSPSSSVKTPSKDFSKCMPTDNLINHTPTRRSHAKPTSLFSDFEELMRDTKSLKELPATEENLQTIECTERLDYEPVCTTDTASKTPIFTLPVEVFSKRSNTTTVHHASSITDIKSFTSNEPGALIQQQNNISNNTTDLDQGNVENGAISSLLDSMSHTEKPALDRIEKSSTKLDMTATDNHDVEGEPAETKLDAIKDSETLDIIDESEVLQGAGRSFEEFVPLALVNGNKESVVIFPSTNEAVLLLPQELSKDRTDNSASANDWPASGSTDISGKEKSIADVDKTDLMEEDNDSVMKREQSATNSELTGDEEEIDPLRKDGRNDEYSESDRDYALEDGTTVCDMIDISLYDAGECSTANAESVRGTGLSGDDIHYCKSVLSSDEERIVTKEDVIEPSAAKQVEEYIGDGEEKVVSEDPSQDLTDDDISIGSIHESDAGSGLQLQTNVAPTSELTYQVLDKDIDKVLVDLTKTLPELSLKEMMLIYRKLKNSEGLLYNAIEQKVEEGSS